MVIKIKNRKTKRIKKSSICFSWQSIVLNVFCSSFYWTEIWQLVILSVHCDRRQIANGIECHKIPNKKCIEIKGQGRAEVDRKGPVCHFGSGIRICCNSDFLVYHLLWQAIATWTTTSACLLYSLDMLHSPPIYLHRVFGCTIYCTGEPNYIQHIDTVA